MPKFIIVILLWVDEGMFFSEPSTLTLFREANSSTYFWKFVNEFIKENKIDLFHYDSDKSVKGRNFAFNLIKDKISSKSVVIFDDIGDNLHFKELVEKEKLKYKIFKYKSDYLGLIFNYNEHNK